MLHELVEKNANEGQFSIAREALNEAWYQYRCEIMTFARNRLTPNENTPNLTIMNRNLEAQKNQFFLKIDSVLKALGALDRK